MLGKFVYVLGVCGLTLASLLINESSESSFNVTDCRRCINFNTKQMKAYKIMRIPITNIIVERLIDIIMGFLVCDSIICAISSVMCMANSCHKTGNKRDLTLGKSIRAKSTSTFI